MLALAVLALALGQAPAEETAGDSKPIVVTGTVAASDGQPAADVKVLLAEWPQSPGHGMSVLEQTRTDAQGKFRVTVRPEEEPTRHDLPLAIWVYRPGSRVKGFGFTRKEPPKGGVVSLKLEDAAETVVRIVDQGGIRSRAPRLRPGRSRPRA
jgi:5-hydroxyisourate hydrolase-like protein (transthyretin family)